MHLCAHLCVCYPLGYTCMWVYAGAGSELKHFWPLSLCIFFLCVVVCGGVYVNVWGDLSVHYLCVRVSVCVSGLFGAFPVLSCLRLVLYPGSTLSAQSIPTMYPGQLALLAPGGLADSASSTLLQPLKPSPSSDNLCSAYTSEAALSVPSLCAPTPGRHATHSLGLHQASSATTQHKV